MTTRRGGWGRRGWAGWLGRRVGRGDEGGMIMILAAGSLVLLVSAAALSVDIGGIASERRNDQKVADLAALDASRSLPASDATLLDVAQARAAADFPGGATVTSALGGNESAAGVFTAGMVPRNAVEVFVQSTYAHLIVPGANSITVHAIAQDDNSGGASFTMGNSLIGVSLFQKLLPGLGTGTITAVGYNGLVAGNVTISALATSLGFGLLTPAQVLGSNVSLAQLLTAEGALLAPGSAAQVDLASILAGLSLGARGFTTTIGNLLGIQAGTAVGLGTQVNLGSLLTGALELANGTSAINLGINLNLALVGVTTAISAIQPARPSNVGLPTASPPPAGCPTPATSALACATATQALVKLAINVNVPLVASVSIPLTVSVGGATSVLSGITCSDGSPRSITVSTNFSDASTSTPVVVTLLSLLGGGLTVPATATVSVPSATTTAPAVLDPTDFLPPVGPGTAFVTASSGLGTPTVSLSGSGLTATVLSALNGALSPVLSDLFDPATGLLDPVLNALGVNIGTADIWGNTAACPGTAGLPSLAG